MKIYKAISLFPPVFWQIVIVLIIFSSSSAGYYANENYSDFMNKGWYTVALEETANPLAIVGTIGSIVCAGVFLLRVPYRVPPLILIILPVQAWLVLSAIWSNTMGATVVLVIKAVIYVNALDCALRELDARKALQAFRWSIAAILLVSLVLCIMDPIFRISIGADGWRGLFPQKNRLSSFCLFSAPLLLLCIRFSPVMSGATLALSLFMLTMSQGKAAIGILALAIMIIFFSSLAWRGRPDARPTLITVCLAFWLIFIIAWTFILYQIDQGVLNFTGRTKIWEWFLRDLGDSILIGKGGLTAAEDPLFVQRAAANGVPSTSDSSYIMLLYNNGVIGMLVFFATAIGICVASVQKNSRYFIYPITATFCYVTFAAMESDTRFFHYYSTYSVLALYAIANKMMQRELEPPAANALNSVTAR